MFSGTFTNPSSLDFGFNEFTAPGEGFELAANTTYWVVVEGTRGRPGTTSSAAEDPGAAAGWGLGDNITWRSASSTGSWTISANNGPLSLRITGLVNPRPRQPRSCVPLDGADVAVGGRELGCWDGGGHGGGVGGS